MPLKGLLPHASRMPFLQCYILNCLIREHLQLFFSLKLLQCRVSKGLVKILYYKFSEQQQKKKEEQDRIDKVEAFKKLDIDGNGW